MDYLFSMVVQYGGYDWIFIGLVEYWDYLCGDFIVFCQVYCEMGQRVYCKNLIFVVKCEMLIVVIQNGMYFKGIEVDLEEIKVQIWVVEEQCVRVYELLYEKVGVLVFYFEVWWQE